MRVLFGIWHDSAAVFFRDRPTERYSIELDREAGEVRLLPGLNRAVPDCADAEETREYPWRVEDKDCDVEGFARCCLHALDLVEAANGYSASLPANHELPWPHARDCETYSRSEELMRECLTRKDSAKAAGEKMPTPPPAVVKILTPAMRVALFGG